MTTAGDDSPMTPDIGADEEVGATPNQGNTDQSRRVDETAEPTSRRRWLWGIVFLALVVAVLWSASNLGGEEDSGAAEEEVNTAEVIRTDLTDETVYDAVLGRPVAADLTAGVAGIVTWVPEPGTIITSGDPLFAIDDTPTLLLNGEVPVYRDLHLGDTVLTIPAGRAGVLTWLADAGTIIEIGDVIARVDEIPVVLLHGTLPMYRTIQDGVEGTDVLQLESALVNLGYDPDETVTIDEEFTSSTESMVERWQEDLGIDESGRVRIGDIIFAPAPSQILFQQSVVGASVNAGTPVLTASGGDPISGSDVLQLEEALSALGYSPGSIDGVYDVKTADAVAAWTADEGHGLAGFLPVGSVVINAGDLRISGVLADVGTAVNTSSPIVSAADLETIVRLDLPAQDQDLLTVGSSVVIVMPDRSETPGTVTFVSSVATSGEQGAPATFEVEIDLDDPSVAEGLDEAPVDVKAVSEVVEDVLAVPVSALLALAEGGFAVEVVNGESTTLIAVDPGFFADGLVEITGNVDVGDVVVVP